MSTELVPEKPEDIMIRIDKFHKHLDICAQCRNHPFDLCSEGAKLLKYAATGEK